MILTNRQTSLYTSSTTLKPATQLAPTTKPAPYIAPTRTSMWGIGTRTLRADALAARAQPAPAPRPPVCELTTNRYSCQAYVGSSGSSSQSIPTGTGSPIPAPGPSQSDDLARIEQILRGAPAAPPDLERQLSLVEASDGTIVAADSYAQGAVQGIQRALIDFASKNGIALTLNVDGNLSSETIEAVTAVISAIGLPEGMTSLSIGSIANNVKRLAEHIASAAGTSTNYIPSTAAVRSSSTSQQSQGAESDAPPASKLKKVTIGFGVILGILAVTRY